MEWRQLLPKGRAVEVWPFAGESQTLENSPAFSAPPDFSCLTFRLAEMWAAIPEHDISRQKGSLPILLDTNVVSAAMQGLLIRSVYPAFVFEPYCSLNLLPSGAKRRRLEDGLEEMLVDLEKKHAGFSTQHLWNSG